MILFIEKYTDMKHKLIILHLCLNDKKNCIGT